MNPGTDDVMRLLSLAARRREVLICRDRPQHQNIV